MRGGERLVKKCSWMSDICSRLYHSTKKSETFRYRCPSSVFFDNRFRSADCQKIQLPLGGSQGEETIRFYHSTSRSVPSGFGRLIAAPTVQVRKLVPFIQPHPLSFAFAQQLPQRGRRGRFAPERVQNGFCAVTNRAVRALTYGYMVRSVTIPASLMPYSSNPSVRDVVDASPSGFPSMRFANCWPVMDSFASR